MAQDFNETAHLNTDMKKYKEGYDHAFGLKPKEFCDECGYRFSFCVCKEDEGAPSSSADLK